VTNVRNGGQDLYLGMKLADRAEETVSSDRRDPANDGTDRQ